MIWIGLLLAWALGAASIYWTDADLRAPKQEKAVYAALWPLFAVVVLILVVAAMTGFVVRTILARQVS